MRREIDDRGQEAGERCLHDIGPRRDHAESDDFLIGVYHGQAYKEYEAAQNHECPSLSVGSREEPRSSGGSKASHRRTGEPRESGAASWP
mmetsp:Transcript_25394/g.82059  ORF Transcript_25394/g.82059 Transcript_25394/m.82059 type:complete len:90 (+) Transcript_25394:301-570(+)